MDRGACRRIRGDFLFMPLKRASKKRYNYLRHPYAANGWYCFGAGLAALLLSSGAWILVFRRQGAGGLFEAAVGFSGLLASLAGLWFAFCSFREKERNYLFAIIGGGISLLFLFLWAAALTLGRGQP